MTTDNIIFWVTAIGIPIGFILFTVMARAIIKGKWERAMWYLGVDLSFAGISAVLVHGISSRDDGGGLFPHHLPLLTAGKSADIMAILFATLRALPYHTRANIALGLLIAALLFALAMHATLEPKEAGTSRSRSRQFTEVFVLGVIANLFGGAAVVYMELLLR